MKDISLEQDCFLRRPTVEKIIGQSTSSLYELMKAGKFPRPVKLNPESKRSPVAWLESEVRQWQRDRIAERAQAAKRAA